MNGTKTKEVISCYFANIFWTSLYNQADRDGVSYNSMIQTYCDVMRADDFRARGSIFFCLIDKITKFYNDAYKVSKTPDDMINLIYEMANGNTVIKKAGAQDKMTVVHYIICKSLSSFVTWCINEGMSKAINRRRKEDRTTLRDEYGRILDITIKNYRKSLVKKKNRVRDRDINDMVPLYELESMQSELNKANEKINLLTKERDAYKKLYESSRTLIVQQPIGTQNTVGVPSPYVPGIGHLGGQFNAGPPDNVFDVSSVPDIDDIDNIFTLE
jgi:hypothetical protein